MVPKIQSDTVDEQCLDRALRLLSDQQRRSLVQILADRESSLTLDELATTLASRETEIEGDAVRDELVTEVATRLHHVHLPKLADADLLSYDAERGTVTPEQAEELTPFLGGDTDGSSDGERAES